MTTINFHGVGKERWEMLNRAGFEWQGRAAGWMIPGAPQSFLSRELIEDSDLDTLRKLVATAGLLCN